jgi:streptogramin lyase
VGNRNTGTVVKVGLVENGQCKDRNGNGIIETSSGSVALPWGDDECVLLEVVLDKGRESAYQPGSYLGGANNSGPRGLAIDADNNLWAGTNGTMIYYHINSLNGQIERKIDVSSTGHKPYGAIVDSSGILWSADINSGKMLRLDTASNRFSTISPGHFAYGLGLDSDSHLFVAGWTHSKLSRIDVRTDRVDWTMPAKDAGMRGVAVTADGDVWVANSYSNTVTRWSNDGERKATITGFNQPTGVAVDAAGKIWVVNFNDSNIFRINPVTNRIEMKNAVGGGGHYGYSDMTGVLVRRVKAGSGETDSARGDGTVDKLVIKRKGGEVTTTGKPARPVAERREPPTPEKKRTDELRRKLGFDPE